MSKAGGEAAADGEQKYIVCYHTHDSYFADSIRHKQERDAESELRLQANSVET